MAKQYLSHNGKCLFFYGQKPIHFLSIIILLEKAMKKYIHIGSMVSKFYNLWCFEIK